MKANCFDDGDALVIRQFEQPLRSRCRERVDVPDAEDKMSHNVPKACVFVPRGKGRSFDGGGAQARHCAAIALG